MFRLFRKKDKNSASGIDLASLRTGDKVHITTRDKTEWELTPTENCSPLGRNMVVDIQIKKDGYYYPAGCSARDKFASRHIQLGERLRMTTTHTDRVEIIRLNGQIIQATS